MIKLRVQSAVRRAEKKRSPRACAACRCRKVRCDVTSEGSPCTSCRFYELPCVIPIDRRGKAAKAARANLEAGESPRNVSYENDEPTWDRTVQYGDKDPQYWIQADKISAETLQTILSSRIRPIVWSNWLPDYAAPLSPSISREDCKTLHGKGAFDVPDATIRAELLRNYVQYIHAALPILDLQNFLMVMDDSYEGERGVSFLLFQSVMFAATALQAPDLVELEGFEDRHALRRARFERVRTLYLSGCEDDRVAILQSVLLMTYWDDSVEEGYTASDYIGVAKAILKSIESRPTDAESHMIEHQPGLWRRLRWSCYIRDRLIAISLRRPCQIDESEIDTPMLSLPDLEIGPVSTKCCLGRDGSHPAIRDPSIRGLLFQATLAVVHACRCITRILNCQDTTIGERRGPGSNCVRSLAVKRSSATGAEILLRDSELEEWYQSLPELLQWHQSNPLRGLNKHGDVILLFRMMLHGIYNLASATLHRPQLVPAGFTLPEIFELSKQRAYQSAIAMTDAYRYFKLNAPGYKSPDGMVTMLESAIMMHLVNLKSTDSSIRQIAMDAFQICAQGLQSLGDTYPSADVVRALVDSAVQKQTTSGREEENRYSVLFDQSRLQTVPMPEGCTSQYSSPERDVQPTISDRIDNLNIPQIGALLSSHFMMTSSERFLLQALVSPIEADTNFYSDHITIDSSPRDTIHDLDQELPARSHQGPAPDEEAPLTHILADGRELSNWSSSAYESAAWLTTGDQEQDYDFFHMMSQSCAE